MIGRGELRLLARNNCLAFAAFVLPLIGAAARAPDVAPPPVERVGTSDKICQLTGDTDWETGRPTAARTSTNFGLDAADLGYPVEHNGKLILLFGDSWRARHQGTVKEEEPADAVGLVTRAQPPGDDGDCLGMKIQVEPGSTRTFAITTSSVRIPSSRDYSMSRQAASASRIASTPFSGPIIVLHPIPCIVN